MKTINEEFRDLLLKKSHYTYRFENGTANQLVSHYTKAKVVIQEKMKALIDTGQGFTQEYRIGVLQDKLREIETVLNNATGDAITGLSSQLQQFSMSESVYYQAMLGGKLGQIGVDISRIPFEQVNQMVMTPLGGADWAERMRENYRGTVFNMKQELTQSVILGEDMAKASRRIFGVGEVIGGTVGNRIRNQAEVIARTEIQRISNEVSLAIYQANDDVVKGVEWVSTLDDRTCLLPETNILTVDGDKELADVQIGDLVFTREQNWKKVIDKQPKVVEEYLEVELSNGRKLKITSDHPVLHNGEWVEIGNLCEGDDIEGI